MSAGVQLTLRARPALRLDLRGLLPEALAGLDDAALLALPIGCGAGRLPLGEAFTLSRFEAEQPTLRLQGDGCARLDRIGWGQAGGHIAVHGDAGDHLGVGLRGGSIRVQGSAGLQAGAQMAGGLLVVAGDVGDHAAAALPGSLDGMRGGCLVVGGRAGARLADRMRRGTVLVCGGAGDFAASRLVAGTVVIGGAVGRHPAWGQRRGSVLLLDPGAGLALPDTFVPAGAPAPVAWQLLARDLAGLAALHAPLTALPGTTPRRWLGDRSVDGRGELILC